MEKQTQGSTKRFGARYGRTIKIKLDKIESMSKDKYKCPYCGAKKVKRKMAGIWTCKGCGKIFTSKAYTMDQ